MGDGVTKKDFVNLEKLVDRMIKEFDDERKVVHEKLAALMKSANETPRLQNSLRELKKSTENTFAERNKWFDDEKKAVHTQLEKLDKVETWFKDEKKAVHVQLDKVETWFKDEKKAVHAELDMVKTWFQDEKKWTHNEIDKLKD